MRRRTFVQSLAASAAWAALPTSRLHAAPLRPVSRRAADVEAVTGDGRRVVLGSTDLTDLAARLRGRVLLRDTEGYDDARRILNPSFDKFPALIVQPTGAADVSTAVQFARSHGGLLLAVKCGGHSASGQSTCDRGMLVDLSHFRDVRLDPVARRAWVTGGSLLGAVDHEATPYDLVTPLGTVSHTGVGGLVTGGGFGRVARRFGLSIDNVVSAQVVTAEGTLRRANATEHPDLFWGVRGGGGNFGIVTSFEFALHPMSRTVIGGEIVHPIARAREALRVFGEYGREIPDDLSLGFALVQPPGQEPGAFVFEVCYTGDPARIDRLVAPLRGIGTPIADTVRPMPYLQLQRSGDVTDPRAMGTYLKSGFVRSFPRALVDAIVDRFEGHPSRVTAVFAQMGGGAIARVPVADTAFAHRDIFANLLCSVGWRQGEDPSAATAWIKQYWTSIEPFTDGFYVNDLEQEQGDAAVLANFRRHQARMVAVKDRYDPSNLFRLNANVKPSGARR